MYFGIDYSARTRVSRGTYVGSRIEALSIVSGTCVPRVGSTRAVSCRQYAPCVVGYMCAVCRQHTRRQYTLSAGQYTRHVSAVRALCTVLIPHLPQLWRAYCHLLQ